MRTFFFYILFGAITLVGNGQTEPPSLSDSLRDILSQSPRIFLKYDTRNSFVTGASVKVRSIKAGADFSHRLKIGGGYNWLISDIAHQLVFDDQEIKTYYDARLEFQFVSIYGEYIFYKRNHWEVSIPVQIGVGKSWYSYNELNGPTKRYGEGIVTLYEPAMAFEYVFLNYFGAGAGVGYRLMLNNNKSIEQSLTSPTYLVKFSFRLGELYRDMIE